LGKKGKIYFLKKLPKKFFKINSRKEISGKQFTKIFFCEKKLYGKANSHTKLVVEVSSSGQKLVEMD